MFKEIIEAIQNGTKAEIIDLDGEQYVTRHVEIPPPEPRIDTLVVHTLTGFVDYLTERAEELKGDLPFVHIENHKAVALYGLPSGRHQTRSRYCLAQAVGSPEFPCGKWQPVEDFLIALQSQFVPNDHATAILSLLGNLRDEAIRTSEDDGITQTVSVKKGITRAALVVVPNPVTLAPYRTFAEIEQPTSQYVFRLQTGNGASPTAALFEVKDTKWQLTTIQSIKAFLSDKVGEVKIIS